MSMATGSPAANASAWRWPALWLRDAPLLLLDEPTQHLDVATAAAIDQAIGRLVGAHGDPYRASSEHHRR